MPTTSKHYYEIIRESTPCHLYFDIEFMKELNPDTLPMAMIDLFKQCVIDQLRLKFNIKISEADIIDLDSSTNIKFSRHLIVRMKHSIFSNNDEMGIVSVTLNTIHN